MITRVVYNNKTFKTIDEYGFKSSNNEVTFNDITIDFTNRTIDDIPYKYQEIKIIRGDSEEGILEGSGTTLFTGYLDEIDLSDMKNKEEFREMTLTLLSPLKMATKRSVSLIGTYTVKTAIQRILQPLIDDGFTIKELNITDGQITTNFVLETVEYCMNTISFKRNIFWHINELKEIFVNSIDYLFGLPAVKTIDQEVKEKGFLKIQPTIENIDYANVINFKNVRLIYSADSVSSIMQSNSYKDVYPIMAIDKNIEDGDSVTFDNPIIIDEAQLRNRIEEERRKQRIF